MFKLFSNLSKKKDKLDESLLNPQRFNDGILIITQDNENKSLKVEAVNSNAINILGYPNEEILDRDFREFLTDATNKEIESSFQFEENSPPLNEVFNKIRQLIVKTKNAEIIPLKLRIVRTLSSHDQPRFQLVINNNILQETLQKEREKYRLDMGTEEVYEPNTKLFSRTSLIKDLEVISSLNKSILGTTVFVEINNYESIKNNFDDEVLQNLIRQIAQKIQFAGREEDIIGVYDEKRFTIILLETPFENIAVPLKRLKHNIENFEYEFKFRGIQNTIKISVNISYRKILANINPEKFLEDIKSGNGVIFE